MASTRFAVRIGFVLSLLMVALHLAAVTAAGAEQVPTHRFDIAPGPLADVLIAFQAATGAKVTTGASLAQNLTSPGVSGVFTSAQALQQLLSGTGLTARLTAANTFALEIWISPESVEVTATSTPYRHEGSATATKTLTPLRDIPQTLNVISRELLIDQAAQSVAAAVKNVPGVSVKGIAIRSCCAASAPRPIFSSTASATIRSAFATSTTSRRWKLFKARPPCCSAAAEVEESSIS
jgi:hypothetical protein